MAEDPKIANVFYNHLILSGTKIHQDVYMSNQSFTIT